MDKLVSCSGVHCWPPALAHSRRTPQEPRWEAGEEALPRKMLLTKGSFLSGTQKRPPPPRSPAEVPQCISGLCGHVWATGRLVAQPGTLQAGDRAGKDMGVAVKEAD